MIFKVGNVNTVILGVENGGVGPKIFILAQILRGAWPKTSKIRILTFLTIKFIIFELGSKFLVLPLCFQPQGYPWGGKHRGRSKNCDPSSNISDFMEKMPKCGFLTFWAMPPLIFELG